MCPKCNSTKTGIYNSRKNGKHGGSVWRRRHCLKCFHIWTSYEVNEDYLNELTNTKRIIESLREIEKSASKIAEDVKELLPDIGDSADSDIDLLDDDRDII